MLRKRRSAGVDPQIAGSKSVAGLWAMFFAAIIPLSVVWSLTNPMFASPDEPAHMVRAQGVIRGDFKEPYDTDGVPTQAVTCMSFKWDITADCMDLSWSDKTSERDSPTDTYPPLFHLVAGLPTLVTHELIGAYSMRIWLAVVCCSLFALSGALLMSRSGDRWALSGLIMALSPMVIFASSTVNPSGITAALSSLIWSSGLCVLLPKGNCPSRLAKTCLIVGLVLFPLLRRDALAWEVLMLVFLAGLLDKTNISRIYKDRSLIGALVLTSINMMWVWMTWSSTATESFISNAAATDGASWASGFGQVYTYILQMIGWFGWLDSPLISETFVILMVLLGAFLILGAASGPTRESRLVIAMSAGLVLVPTAIGIVRYPYLQGRYLFPLYIGLMLFTGQSISRAELPERLGRRLFSILVGLMAFVQFSAFAQNLRRYAVGRTGSWKFYSKSNWHPPMMTNLTALILAFAALLISIVMFRLILITTWREHEAVSQSGRSPAHPT